jgi:hypothetical protein
LDGDGLTDLVTVNRSPGTITVLLSTHPQPPPPPPPAPINLTATTRRVGPNQFVDLKWSGAPGSTVEILRNNGRVATVPNNGSYTDSLGKVRGTFKYNVCSPQICSNSVVFTF